MLVRFVGRDHPRPWNKGLLVGQKKSLQPKHVWSIRVRLEIAHMWRDLALFNLAIDSKLRACDLVKLRIDEVSCTVRDRTTVVQKKTGRPVQFEITEQTRASLEVWLRILRATGSRNLFPSRLHARPHLSTRQYSRLVHRWVDRIGLKSIFYGTAFDAADEGYSNLSQDWQPSCHLASTRSYKTGEHRPLSRG